MIGKLVATVFAGALVFFSAARSKYQRKNKQAGKDEKDGTASDSSSDSSRDGKIVISHQLSFLETCFFGIPAISTLTWFQGDFRAAKPKLENRMKKMMAKNPWLRGRISKGKKMTSYLSYTTTRDSQSTGGTSDDINVDEFLHSIDPDLSPISRDMPIASQSNTLLNSEIFLTDMLIRNGPNGQILKVSLIPCSKRPNEAFALVFQFSHAAGDGATYYKLMHMLCSSDGTSDKNGSNKDQEDVDPIVELIPERIQESQKMQIEVMGKSEAGLFVSPTLIIMSLFGMFLNRLKGYLCYDIGFVDPAHVQKLKASSATEGGVPFVSTNDILTSWMFQNSNSLYGLMAINWRNRLEGHTDLHAGNYENFIFYAKEDYTSPALIRRSLDGSYKRAVTTQNQLPFLWDFLRGKITLVTNWSSFAKPNVIDGCLEDVHFPLFSTKYISCVFWVNIIFRTGGGKIGICYPKGTLPVNATNTNDPFGLTMKSEQE